MLVPFFSPGSTSSLRHSRCWPVHPFTAATSCTSGGYHLAFAVGAGLTAAAAILVAIVLRPNAAVSPPAQDEPAAQPVSSARA